NPNDPTRLQTLPMWGWQAAAQLNILPQKFWLAGGYSEVHLEKHHGALSDSQYHHGNYIFDNAFYNVTRNFTVALEYLHGGRRDMSGAKNTSNRLSIMAQYNF
ncbi:MAG: porin, partial [Alistipes sp.]|nr:porin [Alistipes sp.]